MKFLKCGFIGLAVDGLTDKVAAYGHEGHVSSPSTAGQLP